MAAKQQSLFFADRINGEASRFAVFTFYRTLKSPLRSGLPNLLLTHCVPWPGIVRYYLMLVSIVHIHKTHSQVKFQHRPKNGRTWAF